MKKIKSYLLCSNVIFVIPHVIFFTIRFKSIASTL